MIKIICAGKIKEKFYQEAIQEYLKRLSKYTKIEIIEIKDEPLENVALKKEEIKFLEKIKDTDFVITLEIEGNNLTSLEFAKQMNTWQIQNNNIVFVIGSSYGLSDKIKQRSNYSLSFSLFTFPHQLFRVILLEQIYRSFKINNHETYHK